MKTNKKILIAAGFVLAVLATNSHNLQQQKAKAREAQNARDNAEIQRCLESGRYAPVPYYDLDDPLRVYQKGWTSPYWPCAFEVLDSRGAI